MNKTLQKVVSKQLTKELSSKQKIQKILDFVRNFSYTDEEAVHMFAYGRFLKELGQALEDEASEESLKFLTEKEINIDVDDINISYREYWNKEYPDDKQLKKYEEMEKDLKNQLKDIKTSIKNRKKKLEESGLVIKSLKSRTLCGRM